MWEGPCHTEGSGGNTQKLYTFWIGLHRASISKGSAMIVIM